MEQCGAVSALIVWQPIAVGIVVDCYEVEVECDAAAKSPVKGTSAGTKMTRTYVRRQNYALVRGLLPGKGFQVRVRAHNVCGWGSYSATAAFLTNGTSFPLLLLTRLWLAHAFCVCPCRRVRSYPTPSSSRVGQS
jgi:hypothetical protein